jgi:hypothetical protein
MSGIQLVRCVTPKSVAKFAVSFSHSAPGQATAFINLTSNNLTNQFQALKGTSKMVRSLALVLAGSLGVLTCPSMSTAQATADPVTTPQSPDRADTVTAPRQSLPAPPPGRSTILGGEIQKVDPVRDALTLKVFGEKPMKILFDERTQVFRNGKKIPLHDLRSADHASIQTVLDGTDVFAISIHMLSEAPQGDYQGRVLSYDLGTEQLTISSSISRDPVRVTVPGNTPVVRVGQPAFTGARRGLGDLVPGALVTVQFSSEKGKGIASQIVVLAVPGTQFVFVGNITVLDTHSGILVLLDPRDNKTYQITFSGDRLADAQKLQIGQHIIVTASFDGSHYVARAVTID